MCQRERHAPWDKQSLRVITPQYSAPGRAYDFRGKSACKCWQPHDMVNLIASWQSNHYQITHQMVRYIAMWNPPFWMPGSAPIIEKTCKKKMHNHCVDVITWYTSVAVCKTDAYSYDTSALWFSPKRLASQIGHPTFPCPGAAPGKVMDLKFSVNMPRLSVGKDRKFQPRSSSRFGDIPEKPEGWMKTPPCH